MKRKKLTGRKLLALFLTVLMVVTAVPLTVLPLKAEAVDYLTEATTLSNFNYNGITSKAPSFRQYNGNESSVGTDYYANILYTERCFSIAHDSDGDDGGSEGCAVNFGKNGADFIFQIYYANTVLLYDGKKTPIFPVMTAGKQTSNKERRIYTAYTTNNTSLPSSGRANDHSEIRSKALYTGNHDWDFRGNSYTCTLDFAYATSRSSLHGSYRDVNDRYSDKYTVGRNGSDRKWNHYGTGFVVVPIFGSGTGEGNTYKKYNPYWAYYGDGGTNNYTNANYVDDNMKGVAQATNKTIYVINYKKVLDKIEVAKTQYNNVKDNSASYTYETLDAYYKACNALAAFNPANETYGSENPTGQGNTDKTSTDIEAKVQAVSAKIDKLIADYDTAYANLSTQATLLYDSEFDFDTYPIAGVTRGENFIVDKVNNSVTYTKTGDDSYTGPYNGVNARYLTLIPGHTYKVSYNYSVTGTTDSHTLRFLGFCFPDTNLSDSNWTILEKALNISGSTSGVHSFDLKIPDGKPYFTFRYGVNDNNFNGTFTFSNLSIVDVTEKDGVTYTTNSEHKTVNANVGTLPTPTKSGYTFDGWYTGKNATGTKFYSTTKMPQEDTHLWSNWLPAHTLYFNANGGVVSTASKTITETYQYGTLPTPTRMGYTFAGWYTAPTGGSQITATSTVSVTADQTLYAQWSGDQAVTFDVNHDSIRENLFNPTVTTASSNGLTYNYNKDTGIITIHGTQTATDARFFYMPFKPEANVAYRISATIVGGSHTTPSNGCIVLDMADASGSNLDKNTLGRANLDIGNSSVGITITPTAAQAEKIECIKLWVWKPDSVATNEYNNYQLKIKVEKASSATEFSPCAQTITGSTYGSLPTPTRTGYSFSGWYTAPSSGSKVTASSNYITSSNHTLYAQWAANTYTVTFNANGGSCSPTSKEVTYQSTYGDLPTPTREGYTFAGWYTAASGGTPVTNTTKVTTAGNHTLYAHWTTKPYSITYELDGGTNNADNPTSYNIESETITLKDPTKNGYTFAGWYSDSGFATRVTQIAKGSTGNKTLYAKWTANTYTVTFDANGGSCSTSSKPVTYRSTYGDLPTPTRKGYTFAGWYTAASGGTEVASATNVTTANDHTLYAHWTLDSYTITYNLNGGTNAANPTSYNVNSATITLKDPTRGGYTFDGWYSDSSFATKVTEIANGSAGDVTLYAKWTPVSYSITYELNGGTNNNTNPKTYTIETATINLKNPTKTGYDFGGWYSDSSFTTQVAKIEKGSTGNVTLYAKWNVNEYTVTYNVDGKTTSTDKYEYGTTVTVAATPSKDGYTFSGWNTDDVTVDGGKFTMPAKNVTFTGEYKLISYKITYNTNGGSAIAEGTYNVENAVTLPTNTTKNGYTFAGWYNNADLTGEAVTEIPQGSTGNKEFYAKWTASTYTVTFDANGGTCSPTSKTVTYNGTYGDLPTPTRTGHKFAGWYTEATGGTEITANTKVAITSAQTLYAHWDVNKYTVTYNCTGEDPIIKEYTYGTTVTVEAAPSKAGYTFTGWNTVDVTFDGGKFTMPANDVTFTGGFAPTVYTITYNTNGGSEIAKGTYTIEDETFTLAKPTKTGYTFKGWYKESNFVTEVTEITKGTMGDITLYAKWEANKYTVSFNANGGTSTAESMTVTYDETYGTLPTATRSGYTFDGWYTAENDGTKITADTTVKITEAQTLYAHWTAKSYNITYVLNDGTNNSANPATYTIESDITFSNPTKTGYTFIGWYDNAEFTGNAVTTIKKGSTGDVTLYAKWTVNSYVVTFVNYDGSVLQTSNLDYGSMPEYTGETPTKPADETYHYIFSDWLPGIADVTGDVTYTAQFTGAAHNFDRTIKENITSTTVDGVRKHTIKCTECDITMTETCTFDSVVVTYPTCTTDGFTTHTCSVCGSSYIDTKVDAPGHLWGDAVYTWDVNDENKTICTATRSCTREVNGVVCSAVDTETVVAKSEEAQAPTCTKMGKTTYTAEFTHTGLTTQTKTETDIAINGDAHKWGDVTYVWNADHSECTATKPCEYNSGHNITETIEGIVPTVIDATCSTKGSETYTATFTIDGFNEQTYTEEIAVNENAHKWGKITYEWNETFTSCTATKPCTENSEHSIVETVPVGDPVVVNPTCSAKGSKTYTATFTKDGFDEQTKVVEIEVDKNAHDWNAPTYEWNADYTSCTAKRVCKNDSEHVETETRAATVNVIEKPDCENGGSKICSVTFENTAFGTIEEPVTLNALGHKTEKVEAKDATCTEGGSKEYWQCSKCGKKFSEEAAENEIADDADIIIGIDPNNHDYGEVSYVWTKTADGYECTATRVCSRDETHIDKETKKGTITETKDPNCETNGFVKYEVTFDKTDLGNSTYSDTVKALGHTTQKVDAKDATCTEKGNIEHWKCTVCEKLFSNQEAKNELENVTTPINPNNHVDANGKTALVHHDAVTATCMKTGSIEHYTCSECREYVVNGKNQGEGEVGLAAVTTQIDPNNHSWDTPTYSFADDGKSCSARRVCKLNNEHVETENATITSTVAHDPTCTEMGDTEYTATFTNAAFATQTKTVKDIPALGHDFSGTARPNEDDTHSYKCVRCGLHGIGKGDTAVIEGTEACSGGLATCLKLAVCTVCGDGHGELDPKTHDSNVKIVKNEKVATCTSTGYTGDTYYKCCVDHENPCYDKGEVTSINPNFHGSIKTYVSGKKAATCTSEGYTGDICYECCGNVKEKGTVTPVDLTNHTSKSTYRTGEKAATCVQYGYTGDILHSCCNTVVEKGTALPMIEHSYGPSRIISEPTCTQTGSSEKTCTVCGDKQTKVLAKIDHFDADKDGYCDSCQAQISPTANCSCKCHRANVNFIYKIIYKISLFFWKMFGTNKSCDCGTVHY